MTQYEAVHHHTYRGEKGASSASWRGFHSCTTPPASPSLSLDIKGDTYGHHSLNTSERKRPWKAELCYTALITQRVIQSPPSIYPEKRDMTHTQGCSLFGLEERGACAEKQGRWLLWKLVAYIHCLALEPNTHKA